MLPFDPSENIRNPKVFWGFQGDQKGILGRKMLKENYALFKIYFGLYRSFLSTEVQK